MEGKKITFHQNENIHILTFVKSVEKLHIMVLIMSSSFLVFLHSHVKLLK